jgi:hypothetical protein
VSYLIRSEGRHTYKGFVSLVSVALETFVVSLSPPSIHQYRAAGIIKVWEDYRA